MLYKALKSLAAAALDVVLPPLCICCNSPVAGKQALCAECWKKIRFISPPFCDCCGAPFDFEVGEKALCGECLANAPEYCKARSVMVYDENSRGIILGFKHGDRLHSVPAMAEWMARAGGEFLYKADVIAPVPLHWWRLFSRRYNQAALLAVELGRQTGVEVNVDLLRRKKHTQSQGHLNREQRKKNLAGAIGLHPMKKEKIKGKRVVIVDDVMTTGATANECCKILARAGAGEICVLTLSRVKPER